VRFCERLVQTFGFHEYDNLRHSKTRRIDPTRSTSESTALLATHLMHAARHGDARAIRRSVCSSRHNVGLLLLEGYCGLR